MKWIDPTTHDAWWFLRPRERAFVTELMKPGGATDIVGCAKRAGYKDDWDSHAFRLMKDLRIRAALYQRTSELAREGVIQTEQWLRELGKIAFAPPEFMRDKPTYADKLKALELFGKYHKWLVENVNVRGYVGVAHLFGKALAEVEQIAPAAALAHDQTSESVPLTLEQPTTTAA